MYKVNNAQSSNKVVINKIDWYVIIILLLYCITPLRDHKEVIT